MYVISSCYRPPGLGIAHGQEPQPLVSDDRALRRQARTAAELGLGEWTPLDVALGLTPKR